MILKWLALTIATVTACLSASAGVQAQSLAAVESIATPRTVRIFSAGDDPGSGVIIGKSGTRYTVLTAQHVVNSIQSGRSSQFEESYLITADGQSYDITPENVVRFRDADLALVKFDSNQNYPVATLSDYTYRLYENRDYGQPQSRKLLYSNPQEGKHFVFVAGWPNVDDRQTLTVNPGLLVDTDASVVSNPGTRYQSYELVYSNLTAVGMSGGAVFDSQGHVIGIHGRADGRSISETGIIERVFLEEERQSKAFRQFKIGYSLGISTETVVRLAAEQGIALGVAVETSAPPLLTALDLQRSWRPETGSEPGKVLHHLTLGNQLWRIGLVNEAQAEFDRALALQADFPVIPFAKGFVYGFSKDFSNALTYCNRAVELSEAIVTRNPDAARYYDAWRCRAGALQYLGQFPAALEALNQALQIQDNRMRQERQANVPFDQRQGYHNPNDYDTQGELLLALQQYSGALSAFERAMDLRESYNLAPSPLTLNSRALTLLSMNRPEAALEDLQSALELDPGYATAWVNQGKVLMSMQRFAEAAAAYDRALQLDDSDHYAWNDLGVLQYQMGQCRAALESLDRAISLDPNYSPAIANRRALKEQCP
ncbi:MAG: tetratricopeptide repeat protein [Prochlorotrichaceae cyanobacterium]